MSEPGNWLTNISRATWTLLLAAVAVFVAWQLVRQLLPALVVVAVLLGIYKFVIGRYRHF